MHARVYHDLFPSIVAPEHLFAAWEEFRKGKRSRTDVQEFAMRLEENVFSLHRDLACGNYRHGPYSAFTICDPKQRLIHKALVRDRIVHHAIFKVLAPLFESTFIAHSFSCRVGKGTHRAVSALETMLQQASRNGTRNCFALKCDVYRFFASVDHEILLSLLRRRIGDRRAMELLTEIITSFGAVKGLPIGNLTSQLFANVYLSELDQFIKHHLRVRHYVRYTDDFVIVSDDMEYLRKLIPAIGAFLRDALHLSLHPQKVTIRKYRQGVDFLGYVLLPRHRMLRTRTKRRTFRKLRSCVSECRNGRRSAESVEGSLCSYLGVLSHADAYLLAQSLRNRYWFWMHSC
ncbi:MAG: reverse transcriptase/maturase family protein [Patescibacteria group bacterium]|mgnify:CR=1 FL=1